MPTTVKHYTNMDSSCLLPFLLPMIVTKAAIIFGGGIWIGGGITNPPLSDPEPAGAYAALQAWKSAITDDPLDITRSWSGPDVCTYRGIFCADAVDLLGNAAGKVVAGVDLNQANLAGTFVDQLALLTSLSLFHVNSNRFTGTLPFAFRHLSALTELDLSNNSLSGPFPVAALEIPTLVYLDLRFNFFSGPLPPELFDRRLDAIFLNNNAFSGTLPENLGNSPASVINLANNRFTGNIPISFRYMGIREILLLNNRLTGCVSEGVGLWAGLQVLDVSSNLLTGHLPDSLSCLSEIQVLNFASNRLSGELPDLVCSLRSLVNFTVAANFFYALGQDCDNAFGAFDFSMNCIPGKEMQRPFPDCSGVPGPGLSCLRMPPAKPLLCGTFIGAELP